MCDYSLEMYRSRPAQAGEQYQSHRFPSGTVGLVAPGDPSTAVCVACDARLVLEDIPETVQKLYAVGSRAEAIFARLERGPHHDGVRFASGAEVALQQLGPGVKAVIVDALQAPQAERREAELV
ncbi:MAG TPA: hypothetical protein VHG92_02185 [Afifellaceae bacterium]|nr:hypothetical protein [Afifellaceae bacterium]